MRRGDAIKHVAVLGDDRDSLGVTLVDQCPNLFVDRLGGLLRVVLLLANLTPEEDQFLFVAQGDGAELAVRGTADTVEGVGVPTARELFAKLIGNAVPVYV